MFSVWWKVEIKKVITDDANQDLSLVVLSWENYVSANPQFLKVTIVCISKREVELGENVC